jgi:hypothetical protein
VFGKAKAETPDRTQYYYKKGYAAGHERGLEEGRVNELRDQKNAIRKWVVERLLSTGQYDLARPLIDQADILVEWFLSASASEGASK